MNAIAPPRNTLDISTWRAKLELQLSPRNRGTRLVKNNHTGPLYVQRPLYPEGEDVAHIYLLHPPGGLVSGDELAIDIDADPQASGLLTMPGAGRVYRAREDSTPQIQTVNLRLKSGSSLEWLPLETILFDGANTELTTNVHLDSGSHFIGWEITSLGLPANNIQFCRGKLLQYFRLYQCGVPKIIEKFAIDPMGQNPYQLLAGAQSKPIVGLFVAGPFEHLSEQVFSELRCLPDNNERHYLAGISKVGEFVIGRYLGECSEQGLCIFKHWWQLLRPPLLNRSICSPRIWLT